MIRSANFIRNPKNLVLELDEEGIPVNQTAQFRDQSVPQDSLVMIKD